jgi:site-specific DNA-methyltransferase (adenine-specific)
MDAWHQDARATIYHGDCLEVLRALPDASVDAVVTDPPYGINFMGKAWDGAAIAQAAVSGVDHTKTRERSASMHAGSYDLSATGNRAFQAWATEWAAECLRVLKPGGHLLAFGGTRTWHRLACAIEDAGFEVRDSIAWMYGSGFPKSLDVSKAIDKAAGAEREVVGSKIGLPGYSLAPSKGTGDLRFGGFGGDGDPEREAQITAPATDAAREWSGWGTALKPAHEPIVVARKPLVGTVAANVLEHGTGALNIDACRIGMSSEDRANIEGRVWVGRNQYQDGKTIYGGYETDGTDQRMTVHAAGRWPANVVLDEDQAAELDRQSGVLHSQNPATRASKSKRIGATGMGTGASIEYADRGGASRFFYVAKAPARERPKVDGTAHPTVKPLTLMRWLCRLVTPPDGVILEPFAGSGTTVEAALLEGFRVVAIEREADYLPLIQARLDRIAAQEPEDEQLTLDASA